MDIHKTATVFTVVDLDASLRYYIEVLGFVEDFRFGRYAGIHQGECCIHLSERGNPNTTAPGQGAVYLFCDEIDSYYSQIVGQGASVDGVPQDYDYGQRDFIVRDPDGNRLTFGAPVKSS